jgi:hypothetical protein
MRRGATRIAAKKRYRGDKSEQVKTGGVALRLALLEWWGGPPAHMSSWVGHGSRGYARAAEEGTSGAAEQSPGGRCCKDEAGGTK